MVVLTASSSSWAQGVLIDDDDWCNDYWLGLTSVESGIYGAHGYEYGCGYDDRLVAGSLQVVGGIAFVGLRKTVPGLADYGMNGFDNIAISLSTFTGSGTWSYLYLSGGVPAGHGGPTTYTLSTGGPPLTTEGIGPDNAAQ